MKDEGFGKQLQDESEAQMPMGSQAGKASALPEFPISDSQHLEELALWGARAKGHDGLDQGYWQPWGPPSDLQDVARAEKDALGAYSQWTTKQLRSQRDAVARLAAAHVQLQKCISEDLVDGKANFASAVMMLTEMPRRMQVMEDRVQTLECRVQLLSDSTLSPQPQPRASSNALKAPPSVSDKPSEEAVRECREAVGVMLSMQQNMKQELAAIEEHLSMRSNDFEASLRAAANANHDAVHTLFASHSQEVEALYARSAACEEGLQDLQTQSLLLAEWKDGASSDLFECARRLTEVEKAAKAAKEFTDRISTGGGTAAAGRAASKTAAAGLDEGDRKSVV